jgi:hypothetical protein
MKLKLPFIIMGTVLLSALAVFAGNVNNNKQEVFSFSSQADRLNFLPNIDCDFTNLDARDMNNQPMKRSSARKELRALFMTNLTTLLVCSEIKTMAGALAVIKNKLKLNDFSFARKLPLLSVNVIDVFFQQVKKFLFVLLACLSGVLAINLSKSNFAVCALQAVSSKKLAPVVLRC